MKRSAPISPIVYTEICVNSELNNGDAISNLITVPNVNVGNATSATRISEKLKCSIVRNDRLLVWFTLNR